MCFQGISQPVSGVDTDLANERMFCDVAVVGGGPAGCSVADLVSRAGFDVHVFEEHRAIGEPVDCSGIIGVEATEQLSLDAAVKVGEISSLALVSPGGIEVGFEPPSPLAFIVDRAAFDRSVARSLHERQVPVHLGKSVQSIEVGSDRVELNVVETACDGAWHRRGRGDGGGNQTVAAAIVVLASGPRYRWQKTLGMGEPSRFLRTAQVELPVRNLDHVKVFVGSKVAPGSFAWQVPFERRGQRYARLGVSSRRPALPFLTRMLEELDAKGRLLDCEPAIRSWVIPVGAIRKTYSDRVLAVGDAAGQTKPTTGGGLYYGLLCAGEAAATIVEAFNKGDFSVSTLRRYESRWKRKIGRELRAGAAFRRLGERLTDDDLDDVFRLLRADGILPTVREKASFDWHKDLISFVLRHPQLGRIFLKTLFR